MLFILPVGNLIVDGRTKLATVDRRVGFLLYRILFHFFGGGNVGHVVDIHHSTFGERYRPEVVSSDRILNQKIRRTEHKYQVKRMLRK